MDSLLTIITGLGFRLFIQFVSGHNYKLASSLVGLWEGFVIHHFLSNRASSLDPFIAYAFRLFIDFVITRNHVKILLIVLWTGLGVALSEFMLAGQNIEARQRRTFRSSRGASYPSRRLRVRFDGVEPSSSISHDHFMTPGTMQLLGPSTTRVTIRNTITGMATDRQIISKPTADMPPEKYVISRPELSKPSQIDYLETSDAVPHIIQSTASSDVDHSSPGPSTCENGILTPKPQDLPELDVASSTSSEVSLHPFEPVVVPFSDDAIQPSGVIDSRQQSTPIVRAVHLDLEKPLPPVIDDDLPSSIDNDHDRTPTIPVMKLPPEIPADSPPIVDRAEDGRDASVDHQSASIVPVLESTPRPSGFRAAPRGTFFATDAHVESESNIATPDNISLTESTLTEPESVITVGDREHVILRADAFREQAIVQEHLKDSLSEAVKKSFREGRIRDGHLLQGDIQDAEQLARRLHEKAARRYFYAHNKSLILPPRTIDVHRLRVTEALRETNREFRKILLGGDTALRVIVGRGRHSRGKIPVLRTRMIQDMERRKIPHRLDPFNDGVLIIEVKLDRQ